MKRIWFLLMIISMPCHATIYMQEDAEGNITYSDTPTASSQVLSVPDAENSSATFQVTPELSTNLPNNAATTELPDMIQYRTFAIVSPKDQENIQNQPTLSIEVKVDPSLQKGDKIQLLLDGKLAGEPSESTRIELGQLERGTHALSAIIINQKQQVLQQTNPITIYVNRVNVNFKPGGNAPPSSSVDVPKKGLLTTIRELFG